MSRRSVRSERRLFLADGPKAVAGALEVPERVVEVFATPVAKAQYAALLADVDVTLVDDRALASLSDAVNPAGVVGICQMFDEPLDALVSRLVASAPRTSTSGEALVEVRAQRASKPRRPSAFDHLSCTGSEGESRCPQRVLGTEVVSDVPC